MQYMWRSICGIFLFVCQKQKWMYTMFSRKREICHNDENFTFHNFLAGKCNDTSCELTQTRTIECYGSVNNTFFPNQKNLIESTF